MVKVTKLLYDYSNSYPWLRVGMIGEIIGECKTNNKRGVKRFDVTFFRYRREMSGKVV